MIGFLTLILVAAAMAVICHLRSKRLLLVSFIVAGISIFIHQVIGFVVLGYLDPFWFVAVALGGMVAFIIALLVGLAVRVLQKQSRVKPP